MQSSPVTQTNGQEPESFARTVGDLLGYLLEEHPDATIYAVLGLGIGLAVLALVVKDRVRKRRRRRRRSGGYFDRDVYFGDHDQDAGDVGDDLDFDGWD